MESNFEELIEPPRKPDTCPKCGSHATAYISFGLPSEDAIEDAQEDGDVVFGGCILELDAPPWCCKNCWHKWGTEEIQQWKEKRDQLPPEQQAAMPRKSWDASLRRWAEQDARRTERIIQYYRDRHVRRHGLEQPDPKIFEVDCRGEKHCIALNQRGQLVLCDHPRNTVRETEGDQQSCLEVLRKWKRKEGYDLPQEFADELRKLRRRGDSRRRRKMFCDPLPRSNADRIRQHVRQACGLAKEVLKGCSYSILREVTEDDRLDFVISSRLRNSIKISRDTPQWLQRSRMSSRPAREFKFQITFKARPWLYRIYKRGLACVDGHFIFDVLDVAQGEPMLVLAARERAPDNLTIEAAIVKPDENGVWRLQWRG